MLFWLLILTNFLTKTNKVNAFLFKNVNYKINKQNILLSTTKDDLNNKNIFYSYGLFPRLDNVNENGKLTWYPIGFKKDFGLKPNKITIRDINYMVWRDNEKYYALRDSCSHQGSSFMLGKVHKNTISCPYHGYIFDGSNGELIQIPKYKCIKSPIYNLDFFKVAEKGEIIYLNTIPLKNEEMFNKIDESKIFIEPEFFKKEQRCVLLSENFEHYAKFVTVNSLDICHIGFVHSFGNNKNPNPLHNTNVKKMPDNDNHYKITYEYMAGENSLVKKVYNFSDILVENEYILPHTTVARVKFGMFTSTIITHALPISKFKTKLFIKAYRSYWSYDLKNKNMFYFFYKIVNYFGDLITKNTMFTTLKQDKAIVDNIDKTSYEGMHGKFSILYDMISNHYKLNYKKYYEKDENNI